MHEKIDKNYECEAVKETGSPLSMGLIIKSENLRRSKDVLSSLAYSCGLLGISDDYLTKKEDTGPAKDNGATFIGRDEMIYQEQQGVISHLEYLSGKILEFSNI